MSTSTRYRILVIDDDVRWARQVRDRLQDEGDFDVDLCYTANDGFTSGTTKAYDAAIIDLELDPNAPELEGLELIRRLQDEGCRYRILVLSAYYDQATRIQAHDMGAINFLRRPEDGILLFYEELIAAIRAVIFTPCDPDPPVEPTAVVRGPLSLQVDGTFYVGDEILRLSPDEHRVLTVLMHSPSFVSANEIKRQADYTGDNLQTFISRIRRKIKRINETVSASAATTPNTAAPVSADRNLRVIEHARERGYKLVWPM